MPKAAAMEMKQKRRMVDMTQGSAAKHLIFFALPLLAGFLFILDFSVPKIDFGKYLQRKKAHTHI